VQKAPSRGGREQGDGEATEITMDVRKRYVIDYARRCWGEDEVERLREDTNNKPQQHPANYV
jgi:hypothetical protein